MQLSSVKIRNKEFDSFHLLSLLVWISSITFYYVDLNYVTGFMLGIFALFSYCYFCSKDKTFLTIEGLFSLSYLGSIGLACLRLVGIYDIVWNVLTWICLGVFYYCFFIGKNIFRKQKAFVIDTVSRENFLNFAILKKYKISTFFVVTVFTVLATVAFIYLVYSYGFIPILSSDVHAYTDFAKGSNIVLFCQISVILPSLCGYKLLTSSKHDSVIIKLMYVLYMVLNILICICFKSRDMVVGAFLLLITTGIMTLENRGKINIKHGKYIFVTIFIFILIFFFVTGTRNYSDSYIRNLYDVEWFPISDKLINIYVYITSGYYNFDKIVSTLTDFSFGLKSIYPILILLHLSPLRAIADSFGKISIIPELTVNSFLGNAYYDGGFIGILLLGLFFGCLCDFFYLLSKKQENAYSMTLNSIMLHHLILIFFTTWLSNFQYFIYTIILIVFFVAEIKTGGKIDE